MLTVPVLGASPAQSLVLMGIAAGAALGPDLDHPGATASRAYPRAVHLTAHGISGFILRITSSGPDRNRSGYLSRNGRDPVHRTFTHTAVSAALVGGGTWLLSSVGYLGTMAVMVISAFACVRLFRHLWPLWVAMCILSAMFPIDPRLVAYAATVGWLSHILADACNPMGVPLLWPVRIKGRNWYFVRILGNRMKSGSAVEWFPASVLTAVLNLPLVFI